VPVEMEDVRFKECAVTDFLTAEQFLPSTFISICSQCTEMNVLM